MAIAWTTETAKFRKLKKNWQHFFSTTLLKVYSFCNVNVTPFDVLALYNTKKSLEQQAPIFKVLWKLFVLCWTVRPVVRPGQANETSDVLQEGWRKDSSAGGSGLRGGGTRAWETLRIETLRRPRLGHVGLEWSKLVIFHAIPPRRTTTRSIKIIFPRSARDGKIFS